MIEADRTLVERVRSGGEALLAVISDILDYSRLDAGVVRVEPRPFDLGALIEGSLALLAPAAEAKGLRLTGRIANGSPTHLVSDPDRLRQILLNFVGNAVKFTERGGVEVLAGLSVGPSGETILRMEVRDTGPGIAPEAIERLFQRFVQEDGSVSRKFGGAGLGLAISRRLAELLGGRVGAESALGQGALFWVEAPVALPRLWRRARMRRPPPQPSRARCGCSWSTTPSPTGRCSV